MAIQKSHSENLKRYITNENSISLKISITSDLNKNLSMLNYNFVPNQIVHQNGTLFALKTCYSSSKTDAYFAALGLMMLTEFVLNSTIKSSYLCSNFLDFDSKLAPNLH